MRGSSNKKRVALALLTGALLSSAFVFGDDAGDDFETCGDGESARLLSRRFFWNATDVSSEKVQAALDAGADVNCKGNFGFTPLHQAVFSQHDEMEAPRVVRTLIEAGADLHATPNLSTIVKLTPFHAAVSFNAQPEVLRAFLEAGVRSHQKRWPVHPLLISAAENKHPSVTRFLIEEEGSHMAERVAPWWVFATRNTLGEVALVFASGHNSNPEVLQVLLDAGVDATSVVWVYGQRRTALQRAAALNDELDVLLFLRDAGADPCEAGDVGVSLRLERWFRDKMYEVSNGREAPPANQEVRKTFSDWRAACP